MIMRTLAWSALALTLVVSAAPTAAQTVTARKAEAGTERTLGAIQWQRSLAEARTAAAEAGKLVLWLHVVGDLDDGL